MQGCSTSTLELGENSRATEQEIIPSSMPTQDSEQDCPSGAKSVCTEPASGGGGAGEPDL